MPSYIVMAAMKGRFFSEGGNVYDNFQMMGYVEAGNPADAVIAFFEQPAFPIMWDDVQYLWAECLTDDAANGHHGDYDRVHVEDLKRRWQVTDPKGP